MIPFILCALLVAPLQAAPEEAEGEAPDVIVERIRETQKAIDDGLFEAADSDRGGFSELLQQVREQHLAVIRDLEELIKQARYSQSNSSSGGGGSSDQSDSSPPDDSNSPQSRESDGSNAPDPSEGEGAPPEGAGADQQQEQEGGSPGAQEQPSEGSGDDSPGSNREADGPPPPDPIEPVTRQDTDDRWGLLPPKLQERLMNLHVDDVPARYRTWLEAYVRSMNALEQREGP